MEAFFVLLALLFFAAVAMALIGVPMLFSSHGRLTNKVAQLEAELKKLSSTPRVQTQQADELSKASVTQPADATQGVDVPVVKAVPPQVEVDDDKDILVSNQIQANAASLDLGIQAKESDQWQAHIAQIASEPSAFSKVAARLGAVNLTARIGAIVLIFGAIFLGKYASDVGILTLPAKLVIMGVVSVALTGAGIWYADRLKQYGEILQGTGLAGWLITWFSAHVLFDLVGWTITIAASIIGVGLIGYRSLKQNSQLLAVIAYLGGFLTPFIASSEAGSLWRLFIFMALLNLAVVLTAMVRPWRWLVREACIVSFGLLAGLMTAEYLQYDLRHWVIQLPMLVFTCTLVASFSLLALRWLQTQQDSYIKHAAGILFGVPASAVIAFQALFYGDSTSVALCLAGLGLWYALLAWHSRGFVFLAIAIVSGSMAIPFALSDLLTSLAYSIEGAVFVIWACQFNKRSGLIWGLLLQVVAAMFAFHLFVDSNMLSEHLNVSWVLHGGVIGAALVSAWFVYRLQKPFSEYAKTIEISILLWALGWWLYHWSFWLAEMYSLHSTLFYLICLMPFSMFSVFFASRQLKWPMLRMAVPIFTVGFVIITPVYFVVQSADVVVRPLMIALASVMIFALRYYQSAKLKTLWLYDALVVWFLLPAIASWALALLPTTHNTDWNLVLLMIVPLLLMAKLQLLLTVLFSPSVVRRYVRWVSVSCVSLLSMLTLTGFGNYAPLPYWPILHPLLVLSAMAGFLIYWYIRRYVRLVIGFTFWLGAMITIELNRWLFHYFGIPFNPEAWFESALTQTVWTLVWSVLGSFLMVFGARLRLNRNMWRAGAIVLAVVVAKLFLLDLSKVDTLYRILSFLAVGGLLLAVGYFAPMPKNVSILQVSDSNGS